MLGDRIKQIRKFRGMTQKELGLAIGFSKRTADIRIAQYESGTRTPKDHMLCALADALHVGRDSIREPTFDTAEGIIQALFNLDEQIQLFEIIDDDPPTEKRVAICFCFHMVNGALSEWLSRRRQFHAGIITRAEYMEWMLNWSNQWTT